MRGNTEQGKAFAEFLRTQIETYEFRLKEKSSVHIT
ncbi:hypothetical protein, partial [Nostoc linckia]